MSELLMPRPVVGSFSASDIDPTIVTSRPSRIHTVPSPMTTSQCHFAQGRRSSRAGTAVVMRPVSTPMRGSTRSAGAVVPEAAPGLATEVARGDQVLEQGGRREAGLPELQVELALDRERH